jgi:hypothetical protein
MHQHTRNFTSVTNITWRRCLPFQPTSFRIIKEDILRNTVFCSEKQGKISDCIPKNIQSIIYVPVLSNTIHITTFTNKETNIHVAKVELPTTEIYSAYKL